MIPIQDVIPGTLAEVLRKAPLSPEKVEFAWRAAVGPAVANATTIALLDQVLHVQAKGIPWRREIERSTSLVLGRLAAILGAGVVRRIDIRNRER